MQIKVGKTFSSLLAHRRCTLKEISEATGVSTSTLQEWKQNRTPKDPAQAVKVAAYFGVSLHYFLFGEEDRQEPIQKILTEDFFKGVFEITVRRVKLPHGEE